MRTLKLKKETIQILDKELLKPFGGGEIEDDAVQPANIKAISDCRICDDPLEITQGGYSLCEPCPVTYPANSCECPPMETV